MEGADKWLEKFEVGDEEARSESGLRRGEDIDKLDGHAMSEVIGWQGRGWR